jgi:hypothetical protein
MPIAVMLCAVSAGLLAAQNTKPGTDDAFVQADRAFAPRLACSSNFNQVLRLKKWRSRLRGSPKLLLEWEISDALG